MWGLVIDDQRDLNQHAIWWTGRDLDQREWDIFIEMLSGTECRKQYFRLMMKTVPYEDIL